MVINNKIIKMYSMMIVIVLYKTKMRIEINKIIYRKNLKQI